MNRRHFFHAAASAFAASAAAIPNLTALSPERSTTRKANLKLGTQHGDSDEILKVMAAFGVNHICAMPPAGESGKDQSGEDWSIDGLARKREHLESFGLRADALRLLHPDDITKSHVRNVMMGKSPEGTGRSTRFAERFVTPPGRAFRC